MKSRTMAPLHKQLRREQGWSDPPRRHHPRSRASGAVLPHFNPFGSVLPAVEPVSPPLGNYRVPS